MNRIVENKINSLHKDLSRRMFEAGLQAQMIKERNRELIRNFLEGLKERQGIQHWW